VCALTSFHCLYKLPQNARYVPVGTQLNSRKPSFRTYCGRTQLVPRQCEPTLQSTAHRRSEAWAPLCARCVARARRTVGVPCGGRQCRAAH
jgi:hypothetical protein